MNNQLILLTLLGVAAASTVNLGAFKGKEIAKNRFGALEITEWFEQGMNKNITMPSLHYR